MINNGYKEIMGPATAASAAAAAAGRHYYYLVLYTSTFVFVQLD